MPARKPETKQPDRPEPEPVDEKLVTKAVGWIREKVAETLDRGATEVGEFVLKEFFDDDLGRVRSKNPYKNASFSALVERCETQDLPISKTWLHNAVGRAIMLRSLPAGAKAYKQLPPSHQVALLPVRDPEKVARLADRALERELPVRELRRIVKAEVAKSVQEGRGRPPTPVIVKTLNRSLKIFTFEGGKRSFTKAMVDELDEQEKKKALKAAQALSASLQRLIEKLEG